MSIPEISQYIFDLAFTLIPSAFIFGASIFAFYAFVKYLFRSIVSESS